MLRRILAGCTKHEYEKGRCARCGHRRLYADRRVVLLAGIAAIALALLFAAGIDDTPTAELDASGYTVRTIAKNLNVPWSMDVAPDGRIFFTERDGKVRIIEDGIVSAPALNLPVGFVEGGMLGIALDPDFAANARIFVYYTYMDGASTYNRISSYMEKEGQLYDENTLIDEIPGGPVHDGGRIRFGPDGMLYATTGDASRPASSQDVKSLAGKILRITPEGYIPDDNPFAGSPVFSYGHRNPQGIDWHPDTGILYSSEHGPSGERGFAHDEINLIEAGENFGWPLAVGDEASNGTKAPLLHSGTDTWAPSGASFYSSDKIPEWTGKLLVATLAGNGLLVIDVESRTAEKYFAGEFGRLRDVVTRDDGTIYILTSNMDGRGIPEINDDRIIQIIPAHSTG